MLMHVLVMLQLSDWLQSLIRFQLFTLAQHAILVVAGDGGRLVFPAIFSLLLFLVNPEVFSPNSNANASLVHRLGDGPQLSGREMGPQGWREREKIDVCVSVRSKPHNSPLQPPTAAMAR